MTCQMAGNNQTGTCPNVAADGAACDGTTTLCLPYSRCESGICTPPDYAVCK
jgi:hypothetical protein